MIHISLIYIRLSLIWCCFLCLNGHFSPQNSIFGSKTGRYGKTVVYCCTPYLARMLLLYFFIEYLDLSGELYLNRLSVTHATTCSYHFIQLLRLVRATSTVDAGNQSSCHTFMKRVCCRRCMCKFIVLIEN